MFSSQWGFLGAFQKKFEYSKWFEVISEESRWLCSQAYQTGTCPTGISNDNQSSAIHLKELDGDSLKKEDVISYF
ncbi:hypothetical protein TNIN_174831 [Trichonephila inaurata madagascariensis]|uniref:Uncharacterized protein n=1 Tax=Trichonephila inaurata madagascariensis TaxID=2747483 RepID=A0A8X6XNN0_9ARAC|nr:hypothetical protein TNIN_307021 [Trichonephila inaurata madagascariensis]GFY56458.1 hypothetical protein TNIN_174831 [Trichonephila inaurata madagascariensis]